MLLHPLPDDLADLIARRFKVIGEPRRIRILDHLRDTELSVNDLAARLGSSQQNVSKHLAVLADAGIVARRREGIHVYYRLADDDVLALCSQACGSLERRRGSFAAVLAALPIDTRGGTPLPH